MERTGELEALRRRLYGPDASDDDRRRYAAAAGPAPRPVPIRPTRRRRGRLPVALAALGVVIAVGSGIAAVHVATRPTARAAAVRPSAATSTVAPDLMLAVARTAASAETVHGTGSATVALDVTDARFSGGAFAVLISASDERPVGWTAEKLQTRSDWSNYRKVIRTSPARDRLGATRADEVTYPDDPPRWIEVQAAADARWTLSVVALRRPTTR